jgi:hypothetical protein
VNGTSSLPNWHQLCIWTLLAVILSLTMLVPFFVWSRLQAHSHSQNVGHQHMAMGEQITPTMQAKLAVDKKESEFNHHLTGLVVASVGVFIFMQCLWTARWPMLRYVWPASLLILGFFVLVWSDTELWPFGYRQWIEALRNNPEVLQHKTFAALLLGLGVIEWLRVRPIGEAMGKGWVFPTLTIAGSILLLFHQHEAGMHAGSMDVMTRIQSQHLSYSIAGIGIGLSKGLAESNTQFRTVFAKVWPSLMIGLGLLLMYYRE